MTGTKFVSIKIRRLTLPLRIAFSHNLASRDSVETLVVELGTEKGRTGFGQALPREYLTGETLESAARDIRAHWEKLSRTEFPPLADPGQAEGLLAELFREADANRRNAAYAALDIAALDALARENRFSLGMNRVAPGEKIELVAAIPAASPGKAARLARALKWLGYRRFKVKVGKDADADARRLAAVRKAIGGDRWLAADANQAWEWDEAIGRMRGLKAANVQLAEEPLTAAAARDADFAALEKETGLAIMADETLCTLADAKRLLARGSPSWWNIRLAKNGGMTGAAHFHRLAREHGIRTYGGILVGETSLLAAAAQCSLFSHRSECAEYGFPRIFLKGDPFRGGPGGFFGYMAAPAPQVHGLGISIKWDILRRQGHLLYEEGTG